MKETKFKQTLVQTKKGSRHCERSEAIQGGFKMTEIGLVPNDWDVASMGMLVDFQGGSQPDLKYFRSSYKDGYIRLIQIRDYKTDKYIVYIPESMARKKCLTSDIMIGRYGPPIFQILRGIEGAYNVALIKVIPKSDRINQEFLFYTLKRDDLFAIIDNLSRRSSGQTGVDLVALREWLFALPTIEEQQRIASALSDVDTLIANLEKLITKKKNIKQGAMQQLLTGKKRLPGFAPDERRKECHSERSAKREVEESSGYKMTELGLIPIDWEVKKLSSVCTIIMGQSPDSKYYNEKEGTPLIQGNADIENRETFVRFYTTQITKKGLKGDLILTVRAPVGSVAKATFDCCLGRGVCALRNANDFLYQYLIYIEKEWAKRSAGSTFDSIKSDELSATLIVVPSSKEEQTAIANILSDMDAEISALETKLAKYRTLKTGMMQQLLTGKIRLV